MKREHLFPRLTKVSVVPSAQPTRTNRRLNLTISLAGSVNAGKPTRYNCPGQTEQSYYPIAPALGQPRVRKHQFRRMR